MSTPTNTPEPLVSDDAIWDAFLDGPEVKGSLGGYLSGANHVRDIYEADRAKLLAQIEAMRVAGDAMHKGSAPSPAVVEPDLADHYLFMGWLNANYDDVDRTQCTDLCKRAFLAAMKYARAHPPKAASGPTVRKIMDAVASWDSARIGEKPAETDAELRAMWNDLRERLNKLSL